jgi:hypothetical protein
MIAKLLRVIAVAIAIAGAIDPVITADRRVKPDVSVVTVGRLPDPALADRVVRALESHFTVIRSASLGAAAVVSVGTELPPADARGLQPAFAVIPEPRAPFVAITSADASPVTQLQARMPVAVRVHTLAAQGRRLTVTLTSGGVVVDRATRDISSNDTSEVVELAFVATASGATSVVATAEIAGAATPAIVDLATTVIDHRWAVLVFDRRPSWMSTFVRRTIEADPRFVVTSRVGTSRGASVNVGRPPEILASLPSLELFQTVIAGAPDELTDADVSGLDAFMRQRGGTVVLLLDTASEGRPFEQLTGVTAWSHAARAEPTGTPLASEFATPTTLPTWAEPLVPVTQVADKPATVKSTPAIWQMPIGRGRLIVSGALDAWRYRDRDADAFDRFWRSTISGAAQATPNSSTQPASSASATTTKAAVEMRRPTPDDREFIKDWTSSRQGAAIPESQLATLVPSLDRVLAPASERRPWHPMRSAWWIVPFAFAAGGEWWLRRRRGQR